MIQQSPINQPTQIRFIDPTEIVSHLDIKEGMKIADFGCATGYFVFPLAKKIGNSGVVYALDILTEKLETVDSQAKLSGFNNIITRHANLEKDGGSELGEEEVDWVFLVNMLYQNSNKKAVFQEAKRILKKGGSILVIEWNEGSTLFGPPKEIRVPKKEILKIAEDNQFTLVNEPVISNFHYGLVLKR